MALSERQRRFVEAYMGDAAGNATTAAAMAGYSERTAKQQGSRLLTNADVRQAIDTRAANDPRVANRQQRQEFWTKVYNDTDVAMRDRLKASELLGKSQADFIERREHSGPNGGPIPVGQVRWMVVEPDGD